MEHGHAHAHHPHGGHSARSAGNQQKLLLVMGVGLVLVVGEVIGGLLANSLVLLSDAVHVSTDVGAIALAYIATRIASRPANVQKSYGYHRAEVVAAFLNALALWALSAYFLYEGYQRMRAPPAVDGQLVTIIGALGLAANIGMAVVLHRGAGHNLNVRTAYAHVISDALGSVAAIVAGVGIWMYDARWLDPVTTFFVSALVLVWTFRLTRDSLHILLEGTPASVKPHKVRATIEGVAGVRGVHDLHVWSLTTGVNNLSAHVMVDDATAGPRLVKQIRERLLHDHDLSHVTIEIEAVDDPDCVRCD